MRCGTKRSKARTSVLVTCMSLKIVMENPNEPNHIEDAQDPNEMVDIPEFALAAEAAPNNNNGWIEWDVPLGGEMDEPMVDPEFDEEEMDDDDDDDGPSTATPVGHPLVIMAPGVATQPQVIDDLCTQMDNLEYRHGALTRRMEAVSDIKVANSTAIGEIHPRVTTIEEQVQTLQTALHGAVLQNQQLWTRVVEMESHEGTMMSYMLWVWQVSAGGGEQCGELRDTIADPCWESGRSGRGGVRLVAIRFRWRS
ncbi:hypothetical protein Tco_1446644 [Tanacetum coccineum]